MIKINLLPVKRKKKPKPLPIFIVSLALITVFSASVLYYLVFYYGSVLRTAKTLRAGNEQRLAELKTRIKEVDDFEKVNKTFEEKAKLIEQLRKNQNLPVMMLDEISSKLPSGVWLSAMSVASGAVSIDGYAFTNSDVVAYIDNLKGSKLFSDIALQESRQTEIEKLPLYQFKLTFKVAA